MEKGKGETAAAGAGAYGMRPWEAAYGEDCGWGGRCGAGGRETGKRAGDGGADGGLTCENRGWGGRGTELRAPSAELDRTAAVRSERGFSAVEFQNFGGVWIGSCLAKFATRHWP